MAQKKKVSAKRSGESVSELRTKAEEARFRREETRRRAREARQRAKEARRLFREARKVAKRAKQELAALSRKLKKVLKQDTRREPVRRNLAAGSARSAALR
jgi:hypothetical protein